jgi:methionine biosynthesis protein MetW
VNGSLDEPLPFSDDSFDYCVASEALEHIVHSEDALRELVRVARRAVLISVPNTGYWYDRWQLLIGRFPVQWVKFPWEHVRFWSVTDFHQMLAGLGLQATKVEAGSGRRWIRDWWPALFAHQVCYYIPK